ncbi:MAG: PilZ domain-containing protein [Proteobacteria bacterium]|nr:PilZ domain-containing protein [Pseudomonadota bacterium]
MKEKERRRYFRVDDEMILAWRILDSEEKEKRLAQFDRGEIEYPDPTRLFMTLEADITTLIGQISPREKLIAEVLRLMNRKINLISRGPLMKEHQTSILDERPQSVNVSACGIAFTVEKALKPGTDIQLELVLVPEGTYVLCYGVIIGCEKAQNKDHDDRPYRVNVDFSAIREDDRDKLIQHIMQKEMALLQMRRKKGT